MYDQNQIQRIAELQVTVTSDTIMRSAVLVLGLCALFPLFCGACFISQLEEGATHCQDETDKTWHAVGSSWRNSQCVECSCESNLMTCCEGLATVTGYADNCVVVYDYTKCTFEVVNKNDPSEHCDYEAILK
ncbi:beta-microseminoprotein isoform X2 [Pygocentrus nattereri]|nr:beta-microseminoprotein isoform X2 [Pygocentrus nattereri]